MACLPSQSSILQQIQEVVRLVLNSWPSYQFAVKNQLAGAQTFAKDVWLCEVLSEHLMKQKDLYADELSEWLESVLDTEFDVLSEDGTLLPTSKLLIQLTNLIMNRGGETEEEAKEKLDEHLQKLRGAAAKSNQQILTTIPLESSSEEDSDDAEDGINISDP